MWWECFGPFWRLGIGCAWRLFSIAVGVFCYAPSKLLWIGCFDICIIKYWRLLVFEDFWKSCFGEMLKYSGKIAVQSYHQHNWCNRKPRRNLFNCAYLSLMIDRRLEKVPALFPFICSLVYSFFNCRFRNNDLGCFFCILSYCSSYIFVFVDVYFRVILLGFRGNLSGWFMIIMSIRRVKEGVEHGFLVWTEPILVFTRTVCVLVGFLSQNLGTAWD